MHIESRCVQLSNKLVNLSFDSQFNQTLEFNFGWMTTERYFERDTFGSLIFFINILKLKLETQR